jgi:hypothetical protein
MPKRRQTPARPRDVNELAKRIVDISTGQVPDDSPAPVNPKASKRGVARAAKLTPERRSEIARKAARTRWRDQG